MSLPMPTRAELLNLPEPNWFWHGAQILALVESARPRVCVEIGTNRGCSAIATARLLRTWGGHLTAVDVWETDPALGSAVTMAMCRATIDAAGVGDQVTLWQARSREAARQWVGLIDYLYIDADHTYEACTADLEAWWPHVRVGGLVAGDDYDDPYDPTVPPNVTRAWDAFEQRHGQLFQRTPTPGLQSRLIWGVKR